MWQNEECNNFDESNAMDSFEIYFLSPLTYASVCVYKSIEFELKCVLVCSKPNVAYRQEKKIWLKRIEIDRKSKQTNERNIKAINYMCESCDYAHGNDARRMKGNHQRKRSMWMKEVRIRHSLETFTNMYTCIWEARRNIERGRDNSSSNFSDAQNINLYFIQYCVTHTALWHIHIHVMLLLFYSSQCRKNANF